MAKNPAASEQKVISTDDSDRASASTIPTGWRIAAVVVVAVVLWFASRIVLVAFAGLLFGLLLQTLAAYVHRWTGCPFRVCVIGVATVLIGIVVLIGWQFQSLVSAQLAHVSETVPQVVDSIRTELSHSQWGRWLLGEVQDNSKDMVNAQRVVSGVTGFATMWVVVLLDILVIFFVGIFVAAEPDMYRRGLLHLVPLNNRDRMSEVIDETVEGLRWWIFGKLLSMVIVGVTIGVGLMIIGLKSAFLLAVIAALSEFVPNFGPILAAIPAVLMAFAQDSTTALWVAGLYLVVQLLESNVLLPLVQRQVVRLPPALTILVILLLGYLAGAIGVLVATPLLVVVIIVLKRFYVEDTLHDPTVNAPAA